LHFHHSEFYFFGERKAIKFSSAQNAMVDLLFRETLEDHRIVIIDNGIGIEEQYQEIIFQKFKRLDKFDELGSSGVSISIAKLLAENRW